MTAHRRVYVPTRKLAGGSRSCYAKCECGWVATWPRSQREAADTFAAHKRGATAPAPEDSRARWVRRTRESVCRALVAEGIPMSASALEGNLDITRYTSIGFLDQRTAREISAALRWLEQQGYAEHVTERDPYDPPGKLYTYTLAGQAWAAATTTREGTRA